LSAEAFEFVALLYRLRGATLHGERQRAAVPPPCLCERAGRFRLRVGDQVVPAVGTKLRHGYDDARDVGHFGHALLEWFGGLADLRYGFRSVADAALHGA